MPEYYQGEEYPEIRIYVTATCTGERIPEEEVEMENIEEDISGRDLVTFRCPACGEFHKSFRTA